MPRAFVERIAVRSLFGRSKNRECLISFRYVSLLCFWITFFSPVFVFDWLYLSFGHVILLHVCQLNWWKNWSILCSWLSCFILFSLLKKRSTMMAVAIEFLASDQKPFKYRGSQWRTTQFVKFWFYTSLWIKLKFMNTVITWSAFFVCALTLANVETKGIAIEKGLRPEMATSPRIKRMMDWPPNKDEKGLGFFYCYLIS